MASGYIRVTFKMIHLNNIIKREFKVNERLIFVVFRRKKMK